MEEAADDCCGGTDGGRTERQEEEEVETEVGKKGGDLPLLGPFALLAILLRHSFAC